MVAFSFSVGKRMLVVFVSCLALVLCSIKLARADLINDICSSTTIDPQFCLKALRSDPRSSTADLPTLARIAIDLAKSNTKSTIALVKSLEQSSADPVLKKRYDSCLENYNDTSENLDDCYTYLKDKDYSGLGSRAAAALDGPDTCDDNFTQPPPESGRLKQSSNHVQELCAAICAIANKLQGKI